MTKLLIKNLTKKFGDFTAVDDFSISINEGDFVALVGPSGCGKTTTLRCVAGFIPVDHGEIRLGDQILSNNKKKQYNNLQPFIHTRSIQICSLSPDLIHPITTQNEEVKR